MDAFGAQVRRYVGNLAGVQLNIASVIEGTKLQSLLGPFLCFSFLFPASVSTGWGGGGGGLQSTE